ncbi:MAG TPA: PKD domain-containing protein, partial [Planctomycetota bacterium]
TEEFIVIHDAVWHGQAGGAASCSAGLPVHPGAPVQYVSDQNRDRKGAAFGPPLPREGEGLGVRGPQSKIQNQESKIEFSWHLSLGSGAQSLTPRLTPMHTIELCDPSGAPRLRIDLPEGKDAAGRRLTAGKELTYTLAGNRVTLTADLSAAAFPVVIDPSWSSTGQMAVGREIHTATLLPSGKVLVAGGNGAGTSCEVYDPSTLTWSATASLVDARYYHTATLLSSGTVLVAGGVGGSGRLNSSELFDPTTNTWSAGGSLTTGRAWHAATALKSGYVLVSGGSGAVRLTSCEIYDPTTNQWTSNIGSGNLATARDSHAATRLPDGKILVSGGFGDSGPIGECELFDPQSVIWSRVGQLADGRSSHTADLLETGQILVSGGDGMLSRLQTCELYDPTSQTWTNAGNLDYAPVAHATARLSNGMILLSGGNESLAACRIFSSATDSWNATSSPARERQYHSMTTLPDGTALVAGGFDVLHIDMLATCELFSPRASVSNVSQTVHSGGSIAFVLSSDSCTQHVTFTVQSPANGELSGALPNIVYRAPAGFVGTDTFTYKATDAFGDSAPATVTISVTNTAPVAAAQSVSTHWGVAKPIALTGSDADSDPLTFAVVRLPQHGILSGTAPNLTYAPTGNFVGSDSFTFKVNDGLAESAAATLSISVTNTAPTVTAGASPTSVTPDSPVSFSASGSDPDGDAITYAWDFGDGGTSTEQNPSHSYASVGSYIATVTVTDGAGATGSSSVTITVSKAPTARLTTSDVVAFGGLPLAFDASYSTDPENQIASYSWDFGDGTPQGSGQIISKVYDQPGTYTVTLTITDAAGLSSTVQRDIEVLPASEAGLFNAYVHYKVSWNRNAASADTFSLDATVNVGDLVVGKGAAVALEIAGQRFTGVLDKKLRDTSRPEAKWQVKANLRGDPFGTVWIKAQIKKASLGAGFNQQGVLGNGDPHDSVQADVPLKLEIAGRSFDVQVPSEFKFNAEGTKAKGTGSF